MCECDCTKHKTESVEVGIWSNQQIKISISITDNQLFLDQNTFSLISMSPITSVSLLVFLFLTYQEFKVKLDSISEPAASWLDDIFMEMQFVRAVQTLKLE